MRIAVVTVILFFSVAVKAQAYLPLGYNLMQRPYVAQKIHLYDSNANKKWFISRYSGISTSFSFFRGGNATTVSSPLALQLNRRLNDNLYAFAGASVAPAYVNFNQTFLRTDVNKGWQNKNSFNSNSFGMYSRAEMGLMYVNDARTFSISGSISVENNSYPLYPYPYNQVNTTKPNPIIPPNK